MSSKSICVPTLVTRAVTTASLLKSDPSSSAQQGGTRRSPDRRHCVQRARLASAGFTCRSRLAFRSWLTNSRAQKILCVGGQACAPVRNTIRRDLAVRRGRTGRNMALHHFSSCIPVRALLARRVAQGGSDRQARPTGLNIGKAQAQAQSKGQPTGRRAQGPSHWARAHDTKQHAVGSFDLQASLAHGLHDWKVVHACTF